MGNEDTIWFQMAGLEMGSSLSTIHHYALLKLRLYVFLVGHPGSYHMQY